MKKKYVLGRKKGPRKALLKNLGKQLVEHKRIITTLAKSKALRPFIESIITKTKKDSIHSRRQVFRHFQDKLTTKALFDEIAPRVAERPGGYTRIIKVPNRAGDNAEMALIELVDFSEKKESIAK